MYEQFFGLTRTPFRLESEPDMFFLGANHYAALEQIKHALTHKKSVITLSGLPGTGKTTLARQAIEASILSRSVICRFNKAVIDNLASTVTTELSQRLQPSVTNKTNLGLKTLLQMGAQAKKHIVIIIDEAQRLSLQDHAFINALVINGAVIPVSFALFLAGPRDLNPIITMDQLNGNSNVFFTHCNLDSLTKNEIAAYVQHRLTVTNWQDSPTFEDPIYDLIHNITQGIPRRINSFFDRLLLFSYVEARKKIDITCLQEFCKELLEELNQETHSDLDTTDLRNALRHEQHTFNHSTINRAITSSANTKLNMTATLHTKISALDEKRESLLLVARYFDNPERYKHYSDGIFELPEYIETLLFLTSDDDAIIKAITPPQLSACTTQQIQHMVRDFIRKTLVTSNSNPLRTLGLTTQIDHSTIEKHYLRLMHLCKGDGQQTQPWSNTVKTQIKEAYLSLTESAVTPMGSQQTLPEIDQHATLDHLVDVNTPPDVSTPHATEEFLTVVAPTKNLTASDATPMVETLPLKIISDKKYGGSIIAATVAMIILILTITPSDTYLPNQLTEEVNTVLSDTHLPNQLEEVNTVITVQERPSTEALADNTDKKPTDKKLNRLLAEFSAFYESGDLEQIRHLFTDNAITNDSTNRVEITEDYQQLFALTTSRKMYMSNFNWTTNSSEATGTGTFRVSLSTKNVTQPQEITGEIMIATKKDQQRQKIMAFFHYYDYDVATE